MAPPAELKRLTDVLTTLATVGFGGVANINLHARSVVHSRLGEASPDVRDITCRAEVVASLACCSRSGLGLH